MRAMVAEAGSLLGVEADAAQLDLLRDPDTGKLPANVFQIARQRAEPSGPGRPKGAGNKKSEALAKYIIQQYGDPVLGMAAAAAMPLDQFVELMLIADGSKDREDRLMVLADRTQTFVDRLLDDASNGGKPLTDKQITRLGELVEKVSDLTRTLKVKPGELGLKAYIAQRDTRKEVARFVHSPLPVAVDVNHKADVILNIPGLTDPAHLAEYIDAELTEEDLQRLEYSPFEPVPEGEGGDDEG